MKKILIALVVLACAAYASTYKNIRGHSGAASQAIVQDTAATALVDTAFSDTVDISGITEFSKGVWISYNVGTVDLCDSCNDSLIIIYATYLKNTGSYSDKVVRTDTFSITGIAASTAITSLDNASEYHYIPADSLYGDQLFIRTIVKDAITHAWTGATPAAATRTLDVPVQIDVLFR